MTTLNVFAHFISSRGFLVPLWPSGAPDPARVGATWPNALGGVGFDLRPKNETFAAICDALAAIRLRPLPPATAGLAAAPTLVRRYLSFSLFIPFCL